MKHLGSIPLSRSAAVRGLIFLILVGSAIALWLYTEQIIYHIRDFQRSVVKTQVLIHLSLIDPASTFDAGISSQLVETVIFNAAYPSIITDADGEVIQGYWQNVGIAPTDTTLAARRNLEALVRRMDRVNPPEPFSWGLESRIDTLTVYEPIETTAPVVITEDTGTVLLLRNVPINPSDTSMVRSYIGRLDAYTAPLKFNRPGRPVLLFHSTKAREQWPLVVAVGGEPVYWRDIGVASTDTTEGAKVALAAVRQQAETSGAVYSFVRTYTITSKEQWLFHYGDLPFVTHIGLLPIMELGVILILLSIGFIGLMNIKKAEQRSIWVGMAKETAHQLGTPISSLSGWLELLKAEPTTEMINETVPDMEYDVERLSRVAARFSNVGSRPELKPLSLEIVLDEVLGYFSARLPRMGKSVRLESGYRDLRPIRGNAELLNWAFENIIKNALSAIDSPDGRITVTGTMSKDFRHVILDFQDNGRGIAHKDQKRIMKPGFTTRKRGWGLGLSLVKRIVVDYHGGRFSLLESRPGEGTTFRVVLPALTRTKGAQIDESENTVGG